MKPGIYFGMPEIEYHAIPALSASGLKNLAVSPLDFWVRSWMNPNRVDETTKAMMLGKVVHTRLLEGDRTVSSRFATPLDPASIPGALATTEDLKTWLDSQGQKVPSKWKKADLEDAVLAINPNAPVMSRLLSDYGHQHAGKTFVSADVLGEADRIARAVDALPFARDLFTTGEPEVTIIWECERGILWKARLDWLSPGRTVEVKTISNPYGKPFEMAAAHSIAYDRHHLQAAIYQDAVRQALVMYSMEGMKCVGFYGGDSACDKALLDAVAEEAGEYQKSHLFTFLFCQTGDVNNVLVRDFSKYETYGGQTLQVNAYYSNAEVEVSRLAYMFLEYRHRYGTDGTPWVSDYGHRALGDLDFPSWVING